MNPPSAPGGPRVLVLMPTYNELENLDSMVGRIRSAVPDATLLVLDDSSPDGTGAAADALAASDDHVLVHHRPAKSGLGAAYLDGFRWGIEHDFDVLVEIDADGSHPPESLPSILARLDAPTRADLVIGSRWVPGGSIVNWPWRRQALSRGGNLYTRLALGLGVKDATAGFRAYRRELLESIHLDDVESKGYGFQVDMTYRASRVGAVIAEVPIEFRERELGVSKMNGSIVAEAMWRVTQWGAARIFRRS